MMLTIRVGDHDLDGADLLDDGDVWGGWVTLTLMTLRVRDLGVDDLDDDKVGALDVDDEPP